MEWFHWLTVKKNISISYRTSWKFCVIWKVVSTALIHHDYLRSFADLFPMLLIAQRAVCIRAVSGKSAWPGYEAQHCTRHNGYACNVASCTRGHVALTQALNWPLKVFSCEFRTFILTLFFNKIYLSLMHVYWIINLLSLVCSQAIRKILMVWVCITWMRPPVSC